MKCWGYSPDSCFRCKESSAECLPVEKNRRDTVTGRLSRKSTGVKSSTARGTQPAPALSTDPRSDHFATSWEDLNRSSNTIATGIAEATPSLGTTLGESSTSSPGLQDDLSQNTYSGDPVDQCAAGNYLRNAELLPSVTSPDNAFQGINFLNLETLNTNPLFESSPPPCGGNDSLLNPPSWPETFDMMMRASRPTEKDCQCTDIALELVDQVFMQNFDTTNHIRTSELDCGTAKLAIKSLSYLRGVMNRLESFTRCSHCRQAPRLMTLLVLILESLSTKVQKVLENFTPLFAELQTMCRGSQTQFSRARTCQYAHRMISGCRAQKPQDRAVRAI